MSIDFKISDFFYPVSLLKLKSFFDKSQWFSPEEMKAYQEKRLRQIVLHAVQNVPYYRELFENLHLKAEDIRSLEDLKQIPILTKETLASQFQRLQALNRARYRPQVLHTSGTTGRQLAFLEDRHSNVLEFVYYWRSWGWAGYRLGDRFASFASPYFMKHFDQAKPVNHAFKRALGWLLLSGLSLSYEKIDGYTDLMRRYKIKFLQGMPSELYYFSLFLRERKIKDLHFKAVFSAGEILLPYQRKTIESVLKSPVYDAYGHMERTVAISECPARSLHVHSDYGILERVDIKPAGADKNLKMASILGTTLYNFSMPLLRYDVGDNVEFEEEAESCVCGRGLPVVKRIAGRRNDVIVTPEGQIIPCLFLVFDEAPNIVMGQFVQEEVESLRIRIVRSPAYTTENETELLANVRKFTGSKIRLYVEYTDTEELMAYSPGKFQVMVSKLGKEFSSEAMDPSEYSGAVLDQVL